MSRNKLLSARDYFEEVVTPAYELYFAAAANFQTIYSMTTSLYHFHEWIWHYHREKIERTYRVKTAGNLWHDVVEAEVKDAGFIRDLNNASKHVQLMPKKGSPSTPMHHSANTVIVSSGWGDGGFGDGPYGGTTTVKMQAGRRNIPLDAIAKRLYKFWKKMLDQMDPVPGTRRRILKPKPKVLISSTNASANS